MGYLKERHGMMMLGKPPEGTCPMCAVAHDPALPHNRDSLAYQYKFYDEMDVGQRGVTLWLIVQRK